MASSSESSSPVENDLEKSGADHKFHDKEEEIEHATPNDDSHTSIAQRKAATLSPRLHTVRSHSSQRSYAGADGYTHFNHDEDEKSSHDPSNGDSPASDEVKWSGPDDPMSPKSLAWGSDLRKWSIVIILAMSSMCVTCASALYTSTYLQITPYFHISREVATLGLSIFVAGLGLGPMFLSPLSEFYGRRVIYLCAFGMYLIWLIPCALAQNIETMLIARFFDGLAGSAFLSVAGGTIGDMFPRERLSMPMTVYTASPFVGPLVGPVFGGFINYYANWRWSFWTLVIWAGVNWLLIAFFVPETYSPVLLRRKAIKLRKETGDERWKAPIEVMSRSVTKTVAWSCVRPFQLLFFEQMCLNLCLLSAILLGVLYLFFGAFALVFSHNHNFNLWQQVLTFLGIFVGMVIGTACDPLWRKNYMRLVRNNGGVSEPEFRLPSTILGAVLVPISLFGFGWTTYPWVHWIVPIFFSTIFGIGNIFCFSGIFTFLVECYPLYAASALAANSFARSSFAAAFPLFGTQMYEKLGYQWASSLLGFLALAMMPFPLLFFIYGKKVRGNSRFAQG
ncbi:hypothetical protein LTR95_004153 [Oleoguttula sp. CCFEE 5521]